SALATEAEDLPLLRSSEWVVVAYFVVTSLREIAQGSTGFALIDLSAPLLFVALGLTERRRPSLWLSVLRDWATMPFLLLAYWNVDAVSHVPGAPEYELRWVPLDRLLLNDWGGRAAIERFGTALPWLLELCYLGLYSAPPVLLGVIY